MTATQVAWGTQYPLPPQLSAPTPVPSPPPAACPPVWGAERTAERDKDGTTDWQPVGERRRQCQGTAWRAKTPGEPENSFGEEWGREGGLFCSWGSRREGATERGGGGAVGLAPPAHTRRPGPAWGRVGPRGRLPVRSHNSSSLKRRIKGLSITPGGCEAFKGAGCARGRLGRPLLAQIPPGRGAGARGRSASRARVGSPSPPRHGLLSWRRGPPLGGVGRPCSRDRPDAGLRLGRDAPGPTARAGSPRAGPRWPEAPGAAHEPRARNETSHSRSGRTPAGRAPSPKPGSRGAPRAPGERSPGTPDGRARAPTGPARHRARGMASGRQSGRGGSLRGGAPRRSGPPVGGRGPAALPLGPFRLLYPGLVGVGSHHRSPRGV